MVRGPEQRPQSRLAQGGENLFQSIKKVSSEAEKSGKKLIKLSIGQPHGSALLSARQAAAEAVMSDSESMHEYQDNGSPGVPDFARRFIQEQVSISLSEQEGIGFLPVPGIKPMLGHITLACGAAELDYMSGEKLTIVTTTKPGYPTPKYWADNIYHQNVVEAPLTPENGFRFSTDDIPPETDLIMMNYPHNPTGQVATYEWLAELCAHCERNGIRLFNDAAYQSLRHTTESTALTEVAVDFPGLSWMEAFSASKLIGNGTGWRVAAMVGSSDFIADLDIIKGNADSGLAAPMAAGALNSVETDEEGITSFRETYGKRLDVLKEILLRNGMRLSVEPKAGFFSLWETPTKAFGRLMENAKEFNFIMIEEAGVVGVHFEPYIRYAVTEDVEALADDIDDAFKKAKVSYE